MKLHLYLVILLPGILGTTGSKQAAAQLVDVAVSDPIDLFEVIDEEQRGGQQFGEPEEVMSLLLDAERRLARADAAEVLQLIARQGFYLQMPPTAAELLRRDGQGE